MFTKDLPGENRRRKMKMGAQLKIRTLSLVTLHLQILSRALVSILSLYFIFVADNELILLIVRIPIVSMKNVTESSTGQRQICAGSNASDESDMIRDDQHR